MKNTVGRKPPEGELVNVLNEISPLDWYKFKNRFVSKDVNRLDELSKTSEPPYVIFRFKNEPLELVSQLKKLINDYHGQVEWRLECHKRINLSGTNWGLHVKRKSEVKDITKSLGLSEKEYLARYESELSDKAFEDLNNLTAFLKERLFKLYNI